MAGNNASRKAQAELLRKYVRDLNQRKAAVLQELYKIANAPHAPECKMNCGCGKDVAKEAIKELSDSQTS